MRTRAAFQFLYIVLGFVLACSLALGQVTPASAALRCYVKANATGLNNGTSWANAYKSPQSALSTSSGCTEVWVAAGTYKPTNGTNRGIYFDLKNGVALYGGFGGTETLLTQRNPAAHPTILSANIGTAGNTDNSYHVVTSGGLNSSAILDGFTITGGYAPNGFGGGGMWNYNASAPTLRNLTFTGNLATYGGAMYNEGNSRPRLTNVTFSGNVGTYGAGMYNFSGSSPSLTNVTFSGNSAGQNGGGLYNNNSKPVLMNVTFSVNSASGGGGGMYNDNNSLPIITNSILYSDTGGEIINNASTATVSFSIVQGGYPGIGNLNANPLLKPLGNYGGFTPTPPLGLGSPAVDKGTNTGCPAKDQRGIPRPQDGDGNGTAICDMGATESRFFIKSFQSAGIQDGVIQESSETSGTGGAMDSTNVVFGLGDDKENRQGRIILSFNTAALPDTALITSATLKIKKAGLQGDDPFATLGNILVDVRKGAFSNNAALELTDFQAAANKNAAMTILNNPVNGWYSTAMAAANFIYINKTGLTQSRLRFALDDNDNRIADYLKFYSGDYLTNPALRPQLTIKYYLP